MEIDHKTLLDNGVDTGETYWNSDQGVPFYDATEDGRPNFRCHHCGKHGSNIRYFVFFLHKPTKKVIVVGQICAKKLNLGSKEQLDLQKRANAWRKTQKREIWGHANPEKYEFLQQKITDTENEFLKSLWDGLRKYGSLTEKQDIALERFMERKDGPRPGRPASEKQINLITRLMGEREMSDESFNRATDMLESGLTIMQASAWIERLLQLPKED